MDPYQNAYAVTPVMMHGGDVGVGGHEQPVASTSFDPSQQGMKPVMPVAPIVQPHQNFHPGSSYSPARPISPYSQTRGRYPAHGFRTFQGTPTRPYFEQRNSPAINRRKFDRIQQWNAEHNRVSHIRQGYSSMSRTSSMVSGISGISRLSNGSQYSALSISTQMTDLPNPIQMQRSNQYSSASSATSYAENIDPTCSHYFFGVEQHVDEVSGKIVRILEALRGRNFYGNLQPETLRRISRKVYTLINQYDLTRVPHEKLKFYLTNVLRLIDCPPEDQEEFLENPEKVLLIFARRFNYQYRNFDFCNYAVVILHTMLLYANERKIRFDLPKKVEMMNQALLLLCEFTKPNLDHRLAERSKRIIIDISRVLVFGDEALKKYFAEKRGIETLLWFLLNEPSEEVMYYAAHSLRHMLHCCHKSIAERCVAAGGIQILAEKLSHGSPRLLVECSDCLSAMSDVDSLRQHELPNPLLQVLQILGSSEPELMKHSLAFLGNVISSSGAGPQQVNPNKEFLIMHKGLESIVNVLRYYIPQSDSPLITFEIVENGVFALKNLTSPYGLDKKRDFVDFVRQHFANIDGALNILLEHLLNPVRSEQRGRAQFQIFDIQIEIRHDLLTIIQRLVDSSLTDCLFSAHSYAGNNCVDVLLSVLLQSATLKESCPLSFEAQLAKLSKTVDSVLIILEKIVDSPIFYLQMQPLIGDKFNHVMQSATGVQLPYALLRAIEIIASDQSTKDDWSQDANFLDLVQFYVHHRERQFSDKARKIIAMITGDSSLDSSLPFADILNGLGEEVKMEY